MVIGVNARLLYTSHLEGVARYIFETTCEMALQHPEDTFILYFDRWNSSGFVYPDNVIVKTIYLPTRHPLLWKLWFDWLLPFRLKLDKIDVFYSGDGMISNRTNIPQIMVTHDLAYLHYPEQVSKSILTFYEKNIPVFHKKAKAIIAVSEFTKKDIVSKFNICEEKISVAYNGVRNHHISESNIRHEFKIKLEANVPYFCYVGALHPRKNIIKLCEGFIKFKENSNHSSKLVIAGRLAWHTKEIEAAIMSHPDIIYLGQINDAEKFYLLKRSVSLVYISLFEGFGIPLLEAMLMGTGVITSNVSSMPEVVGNAAILVNPNSPEEVSGSFTQMLNPETREKLLQTSISRLKLFNWKDSAEIIYRQIKSAK